MYKTQFCESPLKADGSSECAEYGKHCCKAHGEADLRQPLVDETGGVGAVNSVLDADRLDGKGLSSVRYFAG